MKENPIDKDKVTETPGSIPYPHHVGSPSFSPINKKKSKSRALTAMEEQTQSQLEQIKQQMELLATQAKKIQDRIKFSNDIYMADMNFEPLVAKTYHLYENKYGGKVLSMIGPNEWGKSCPFPIWLCTCKLLADHTWEIIEQQ